ncbi:acyltransferase family protein [Alteriqipengyuania sp. 357]
MPEASPSTSAQRYHHLDAGRALFMLLGIPFHASLAFAGGHWLVMSGTRDPFLAAIPPILSDFRMPGFFLIAGFFAAMLLERRSRAEWLKGRAERLGVPLLFGMATIVPMQAAILRAGPTTIIDRAAPADPLSHLWFLPTLLVLCALLAALWPLLTRVRPMRTPGVIALGLGIAVYELALLVGEHVLHSDLSFAGGLLSFDSLARFAPFFAIGVALRRSPALWDRFARFDPTVAIIGLVALGAHVWLWEGEARAELVLDILFDGLSSLCLAQTILALLLRVVRTGSATIDRLVDASFTIYLLHHPVVVALAILCIGASLPPLASWLIICVGAFVLPYGAHRLLRRSPLVLWLMNGVRPKGSRRGLLMPRPATDLSA